MKIEKKYSLIFYIYSSFGKYFKIFLIEPQKSMHSTLPVVAKLTILNYLKHIGIFVFYHHIAFSPNI